MERTEEEARLRRRWTRVGESLGLAMLIGAGVSLVCTAPVALHHLAQRDGNAELAATNDFYRHLAGQDVVLDDHSAELARTIELWVIDTPPEQYHERLGEMTMEQGSINKANNIPGAGIDSELSITTITYSGGTSKDYYVLDPAGIPAISKALEGDLDVVLVDESTDEGSWFLPGWTYLAITALASSIGAVRALGGGVRHRLNWSLSRATARRQLASALMSPHVMGLGLMIGTLKRVLDRSTNDGCAEPVDTELEQARVALNELLALTPRTASVDAAIRAVEDVVGGIEDQRRSEAALHSDRRVNAILEDVELLSMSARARGDAQRELG